MVKDYKRSITHSNYKNPEKLKKYYHRVAKILYAEYKVYEQTRASRKDYKLIDDSFVVTKHDKWGATLIGGGISLSFVIGLSFVPREELSPGGLFIIVLCSVLTLFFLLYGITQPVKEHILNRRDGLITMTGFFW